MNIFIDNTLLQKITENKNTLNSLTLICQEAKIIDENQKLHFLLNWPSFLEYLNLGNLFEFSPKFGDQNKFFDFAVSTLSLSVDKEIIFHLFDQIFAECLTQIRALPQIQQAFLINQIQKKRHESCLAEKEMFAFSLNRLEKFLVNDPYNTLHDLILYLAWDRVCIHLAFIFEYATENINFINGVRVLKDCLIESFQHILAQAKTLPGFFRLMEALYAYQMREENLQNYHESDWLILCQGAQALRQSERVVNIPYIDEAIKENPRFPYSINEPLKAFTMDPMDKIHAGLSLAGYMDRLLENECLRSTHLKKMEIVNFKEVDSGLSLSIVLN